MIAVTPATKAITPTAAQVTATAARSTVSPLTFVASCSRPSATRTGIDGFCSCIVSMSLVVHRDGVSALGSVFDEFAGFEHKAHSVFHALTEVETDMDGGLIPLHICADDEYLKNLIGEVN